MNITVFHFRHDYTIQSAGVSQIFEVFDLEETDGASETDLSPDDKETQTDDRDLYSTKTRLSFFHVWVWTKGVQDNGGWWVVVLLIFVHWTRPFQSNPESEESPGWLNDFIFRGYDQAHHNYQISIVNIFRPAEPEDIFDTIPQLHDPELRGFSRCDEMNKRLAYIEEIQAIRREATVLFHLSQSSPSKKEPKDLGYF